MIIDRLYQEVEEKGNVCLGLDTSLDYVPDFLKEKYRDLDEIIFHFNKKIIDATIDLVPVYKLQIAFYEAYGLKGLAAYKRTLAYLKSLGSISIGDVKRGDIASTAEMYARAHFQGEFEADFITLNPYMGFDSIEPYLKYLDGGKKGIFVLLRTSNPGAKDIQYLEVDSVPLYSHVGDRLNEMGKDYIGSCGYSSLGAVVGGTHTEEAREIRERYQDSFFLIPGYGSQGGRGKDISLYLEKGNGGIVNSSRGIILAYRGQDGGEENFDKYARQAVLAMKGDIENESRL